MADWNVWLLNNVIKHIFFGEMLARFGKTAYFCIVFFMVLDLRLIKDWVVVMTTFLFL